jgi:WD40 repeat protein
MRRNKEQFGVPGNTFCIVALPDPGQVGIIHAGLFTRLDVRAGTLSGSFSLWQNAADAKRLSSFGCVARPGRAEFAIGTTTGVELWDANRGELIASLPVEGVGKKTGLWFSPDGSHLAVVGIDGTLELWNVDQRRRDGGPWHVVDSFLGVDIAGFPAADRIVLQGLGVLRVWDVEHGAPIADTTFAEPGSGAISRDGSVLMYWGMAGLARLPLDPKVWADHLCRVVGRDLTPAERRALPSGSTTDRVC